MCGIVGYIGSNKAKNLLLEGIQRLEYRGYDSAGIALYNEKTSEFVTKRKVGAVQNLIDACVELGDDETRGIAHTRWATHGVPSENNAHPHKAGRVALVHNGIVENYAELREALSLTGHKFQSQTDTEVIAAQLDFEILQLVGDEDFSQLSETKKLDIVSESLSVTVKKLHGHYAIVFMVHALPNHIFGAQMGAPLVVSTTEHGCFFASDMQAILPHTDEMSFVPQEIVLHGSIDGKIDGKFLNSNKVWIPITEKIEWSSEEVEKQGHPTFMLKEILEQPTVVANCLSGRLPANHDEKFVWENPTAHERLWSGTKKVYLIACGTAYYAANVAKYYFEKWAKIPVEIDLASEFRYRSPLLEEGTVVGVISQSGETADTLAALRLANESGAKTFCVCNVPGSTIMRESAFQYPTKAGPEIGVASTKAFTAQLTVLASLALDLADRNDGVKANINEEIKSIARLPHDLTKLLEQQSAFRDLGSSLKDYRTILFVGRGVMYPIALEGALKLKEITYRHAEGYAAGELKHGPLALVDDKLVTVVLSPPDHVLGKTLSNLEEIKARGGHIIGVGEEGCVQFEKLCDQYIALPKVSWGCSPLLYTVPCQLIAYGLAEVLGCNIDKPRNLAKSVTVE